MVQIDMSGIEARDDAYAEVPRGVYVVESEDYSVFENSDQSKHPGAESWSLHLRIQEGPFEDKVIFGRIGLPCQECIEAGEPVDGHGEDNYVPYDLFNVLRATIGQHDWTAEDISSGAIDVSADDLVSLKFRVRYGKQKNSDYMQVKKYMPLKDGSTEDSELLP